MCLLLNLIFGSDTETDEEIEELMMFEEEEGES